MVFAAHIRNITVVFSSDNDRRIIPLKSTSYVKNMACVYLLIPYNVPVVSLYAGVPPYSQGYITEIFVNGNLYK
jgi:hypothetical protein